MAPAAPAARSWNFDYADSDEDTRTEAAEPGGGGVIEGSDDDMRSVAAEAVEPEPSRPSDLGRPPAEGPPEPLEPSRPTEPPLQPVPSICRYESLPRIPPGQCQ